MSTPKSSRKPEAPRPVLRINAAYHAAPGSTPEALLEDAMILNCVVEDIVNTVAHDLCNNGEMVANPNATANMLFGAYYLLQLASGGMLEAHRITSTGGEA
jgi:hypothetical protein